MTENVEMRRYFALFAVAAAVRIVIVSLVDPYVNLIPGAEGYFLEVAQSIIGGSHSLVGHPTSYRPPLYPAFLALLNATPDYAYIAQAVMGIGTPMLTYHLLKPRSQHAFPISLGLALLPFVAFYELRVLAEPLYIYLLWFAWLLMFCLTGAILPGILLGMAILTRDSLLLLPLFGCLIWFVDRNMGKRVMIAALTAYLVVLPWAARNATIPNGEFALSTGRGGYNVWIGTWERNGEWMRELLYKGPAYPPYAFKDERQKRELAQAEKAGLDAPFAAAAIERMKSQPLGVLGAWAIRYPYLWGPTRIDQFTLRVPRNSAIWYAVKVGLFLANLALLGLGIAGMWLTRRRRWNWFAIPVIYTALISIPFHNVENRYSLAATPFLTLFAVLALRERRRISQAKTQPA